MADPFPNVDEFGLGSCTCNGTMTGCAVCATADVLLRFGKKIPRLSDGTPDMRTLGARMGARHRAAAAGNRHGRSLSGICTPPNTGTNWCAYCAFLELRANGIPARYVQLTFAQIELHAKAKHPIILPGWYGRIPVVSEGSYSSTVPARGRSDTGFVGAHMVVLWGDHSRYTSGAVRDFDVSDPDFGSPSRPTVPPHSVWSRGATSSYWSALGWAVCLVDAKPPSLVPVIPWWGSDVESQIRSAYTATSVGAKLRELGITTYGKAINNADLIAGFKKRRIAYGTSVDLVDVRNLMLPGTGPVATGVKWGSEVPADIRARYTATAVGTKLLTLGISSFGSAINLVDIEAGLEKRGIDYGTSVQLVDVDALMKPGTGP